MWGRCRDLGICQLCLARYPNKTRISSYCSYIRVGAWGFGWSWALFILESFIVNTMHKSIIIETTDIVHNILTIRTGTVYIGVGCFPLSKFLPMTVR